MVLLEPAAVAAGTSLLPRPTRSFNAQTLTQHGQSCDISTGRFEFCDAFPLSRASPVSVHCREADWLDILLTDSGARSRPTACAPRFAKSKTSYPRLQGQEVLSFGRYIVSVGNKWRSGYLP